MGRRRDGTLAVVTLVIFFLAFVLAGATLSLPWFLVGALVTVVFEALSTRAYDRVRRHWERPAVQTGTLVSAVAIAVIGTWVAPSRVLSAGIGALSAYFCLLVAVTWRGARP
ncbi:hypothetical protein ACYJ1Y_16400 [Natrialbaceae archaeon A-gly3]